jgi:RuvB-like protein 1 (pontin 52)
MGTDQERGIAIDGTMAVLDSAQGLVGEKDARKATLSTSSTRKSGRATDSVHQDSQNGQGCDGPCVNITNVLLCPIIGSEVYSSEIKTIAVQREEWPRAIRMRTKEARDVGVGSHLWRWIL